MIKTRENIIYIKKMDKENEKKINNYYFFVLIISIFIYKKLIRNRTLYRIKWKIFII